MKQFVAAGLVILGLLAAAAPKAAAQGTVRRHLIYLRDKTGTPFSVAQPQAFLSARALARRQRQRIVVLPRDLPVNPAYVAQVRAVAGQPTVHYTSKWFNALVVACDSPTLRRIQALPIVAAAQTLNRGPKPGTGRSWPAPAPVAARTTTGTRADYGPPFTQNQVIGAVAMHDAGFRGEGMQIAVFDAGFPGVDRIPALQPLFAQNRLLGTRNFVDGGRSVYLRDSHGTNCLGLIGAEQAGFYIGTAPRAAFHLCITEDVNSEHPIEEANWLAAAEYADSAGVDIISSSLGYTTFDAPSVDYTYADMNGRTALSTRAAAVAARVGMLVLVANGNEGRSAWHYLSAPADADSIISVGAVDSTRIKAGFSSFGPSADGRIKPTLSAQGVACAVLTPGGTRVRGNGTSYACPELAGMAAGLWQANPRLTAQQIILALRSTASQANNPDNNLGYGIPNFSAANIFAQAITLNTAQAQAAAADELTLFPNPTSDGQFLLRLPRVLQLPGNLLEVTILDARGAVVRRLRPATATSATGEVAVVTGQLAPGTYLCQVSAGDITRTVQFVQQ